MSILQMKKKNNKSVKYLSQKLLMNQINRIKIRLMKTLIRIQWRHPLNKKMLSSKDSKGNREIKDNLIGDLKEGHFSKGEEIGNVEIKIMTGGNKEEEDQITDNKKIEVKLMQKWFKLLQKKFNKIQAHSKQLNR